MTRVNLGDEVKDMLSGMVGIVVSRTEFMYGCIRIGVQPKKPRDGKPAEPFTVDEPQVKIVRRSAIKNAIESNVETADRKHGDRPTPLIRPGINAR